jgi:glycosyltransferase involved in cell wall biosynthesis
MPPLVSICMPAFNAAPYINEAIQSIIDQTYTNWELIIVNDGSTDNTATIIEALNDKRIQIINQPNKGAATARNKGYKNSRGTYIKFLDADDIINAGMIAQQVELASKNPNCIISSKWSRFYNNDLSSFKLSPEECWQDMPAVDWVCSSWKYTNSTTVPGVFLIPREIVEQARLWNESLSLLDDTEYFARTILKADQVIFSPNSTLYYRSGLQDNLSGRKDQAAHLSAFEAYNGVISTLLAKRNDRITQQLAANIWQLFIYTVYPGSPELVNRAQKALSELPPPNLSYPAGGYTRALSQIIGWKATKILKSILEKKA